MSETPEQKYNKRYWKSHRAWLLIKRGLKYKNDPLFRLRQIVRSRQQTKEKTLLRQITKGEDRGKKTD